jgi:putative transcriptional regulator
MTVKKRPEAATRQAGKPVRKARSPALAAVFEFAAGAARAGLIDKKTMRSYEDLCLAPPAYGAADVVRIRRKVKASQAYFARSLNVSASALQQWESGAKRPSGSAAKLLAVVDKHGLEVLA